TGWMKAVGDGIINAEGQKDWILLPNPQNESIQSISMIWIPNLEHNKNNHSHTGA
ncbi:hypothetical protein ACJX0J_015856, partial [Zea mays]